ncbi:MAG: cell envelope integrity protein TolA, partial [Lachnospiraceae bacterium]|nr:cell envelope integrity protein TolA [Lachnospiraceae bacterium]
GQEGGEVPAVPQGETGGAPTGAAAGVPSGGDGDAYGSGTGQEGGEVPAAPQGETGGAPTGAIAGVLSGGAGDAYGSGTAAAPFGTDYVSWLGEAKGAVLSLAAAKEEKKRLEDETAKAAKTLDADQKALAAQIAATVKKRREEASASYDKELSAAGDKLKKQKALREKAKSKGMKEKIHEDTAGFYKENKELVGEVRTLFRQNKVPGFCNSEWFYTLYMPSHFFQVLRLLLVLVVCFVLIPYGAYQLIPGRRTMYLVLIYIAAIVVFGGLYLLIGNHTKTKKLAVLEQGKALRDRIRKNKKQAKAVKKAIRKGKDDQPYGLGSFDDEIARLEQEIDEVEARKKDALNTFDTVTKVVITDEITQTHRKALDEESAALNAGKADLEAIQSLIKEKTLEIADKYKVYLGEEFLGADKIDALTRLLSEGTATNLNDAIEHYRKGA